MANRVNLGNIIGATGLTGPQGPAGQNGADGLTPYIQNGTWWIGTQDTGVIAKGNEWYYGTEIPTTQGNNGDLYLRTSTSDVYKKENGIWGLITNIKGAKGDKGDKGDTALTVTVGTVTTVDSDIPASVTNSGTNTDLVLDFVIPKGETGEQGEKGDRGATTVSVGGFVADNISFDSDPQTQINNKLSGNFGSENEGKYLQIDINGQLQPSEINADTVDDTNTTNKFVTNTDKTTWNAKADVSYVDNKFNGAAKAISFSNYSAMITEFNALDDDVYNVGQNVNIVTLNVPDLWVSSIESTSVPYTYVDDATFTNALLTNGYVQVGYYRLSALETQKVDLTDYQEKLTAGTGITIDSNNVISASGGNAVTLGTETQTFDGDKTLFLNNGKDLIFRHLNTNNQILIIPARQNDSCIRLKINSNVTSYKTSGIDVQFSGDTTKTLSFPNNAGTLALTSDIDEKIAAAITTALNTAV